MQAPSGSGLNKEPNVIPMIDVLLVLIVSAMLPFIFPNWKVEVQLPQPVVTPAPLSSNELPLVLSIKPGPSYELNGHAIPRDALVPELDKVFGGRPDRVLFIDAARSVRYADVFWVYGAVRSAGVTVTAIVPKETRRITSPVRPTASARAGT